MVYGLDTQFGFGKHKGESVRAVIAEDINYIVWCLYDIEFFELDEDAKIDFLANKKSIFTNTRLLPPILTRLSFGIEDGDYELEFDKAIEDLLSKNKSVSSVCEVSGNGIKK